MFSDFNAEITDNVMEDFCKYHNRYCKSGTIKPINMNQ